MIETICLTKSENSFLDCFPEDMTFFTRGSIPEKRIPTVAIVGTRKPTKYGEETAYNTAYELAKQGVVIISGLAIGVDAAAHRGALDARGKTIAVLAGGTDDITPRQNNSLGERILANGGAIISEYKDGTPVYASQLLARNRIVSGLSDAVIIVEAAAKSGTLATARHAMRQNRSVFVVPGRLTDKMSAGCHFLLDKYPEKVRIFTSTKNLLCQVLQVGTHSVTSVSPDAQLSLSLPASKTSVEVKALLDSGASSTTIMESLNLSASELAIIQTELELFS